MSSSVVFSQLMSIPLALRPYRDRSRATASCAVRADFDRADRALERLRDLVVTLVFEAAQHQDLAPVRGQRLQRAAHELVLPVVLRLFGRLVGLRCASTSASANLSLAVRRK